MFREISGVQDEPDDAVEKSVALHVAQENALPRDTPRFAKMLGNILVAAEVMRHLVGNDNIETFLFKRERKDRTSDGLSGFTKLQRVRIGIEIGHLPRPTAFGSPGFQSVSKRAVPCPEVEQRERAAFFLAQHSRDKSLERFGKMEEAIDAREFPITLRRFGKGTIRRIKIFCLRRATTQKHPFAYDMLATQVKLWMQRQTPLTIFRRIAVALLVTIALNAVFNRPNQPLHTAGFLRGLTDGALMPGALPPLLMGRDVSIYAPNNTGRTYKLGYTVGVNGCGALFFGVIFWRMTRLKKRWAEESRARQTVS